MKGFSEADQLELSEKEAIHFVIANALSKGSSISLWRLPDSDQKNLIVATKCLKADDIVVEESEPGFLIVPFKTNEQKYFLRADQVYVFKAGEIHSDPQPIIELVSKSATDVKRIKFHSQVSSAHPVVHHDPFLKIVQKAVAKISEREFEKVVPSRSKPFDFGPDFDPLEIFDKLCAKYPHAFVSFVSTPEVGTWLGASPELLVSVDENKIFRTAAVAGTQRFPEGSDPKNIAWTQKEIEEQALVSRYIINCLKQIRLREFVEHGPKTSAAGNLIHLRTDYEVDMAATNFPHLGTVMTKLLHPTSAVCGMPMEPALKFLLENEPHERELYSGYLGPVNFERETHLFVNLRCMQLQNETAILYAGAGVTEDSDPEREWEETEMKMNTLLEVIKE